MKAGKVAVYSNMAGDKNTASCWMFLMNGNITGNAEEEVWGPGAKRSIYSLLCFQGTLPALILLSQIFSSKRDKFALFFFLDA